MPKIIIKTKQDKNQYLLTGGGYWVRNFASRYRDLDINNLYSTNDKLLMITNESENKVLNIPQIDSETIRFGQLAIISDGFDYVKSIELIKELGKRKIPCIGVNSTLAKWVSGVRYNYYLVNNPNKECLSYLPRAGGYLPACIASVRTNSDFIRRYKARGSVMYWYTPAPTRDFCSKFEPRYYVDDYRNAICAAINLACKWEVYKLLLIAPHDLYLEERPGTEKLESGLYMYPQQRMCHDFIDASLYWQKNYNECEIGVITSGPSFSSAITLGEKEAIEFLQK